MKMAFIDLTAAISNEPDQQQIVEPHKVKITLEEGSSYTGMVFDFNFSSMTGTYLDFPGHIRETDDGMDAGNYPLHKLVGIRATVLHLDRASRSGEVSASDLATVAPQWVGCSAVIVNALGTRRFDEIENRSVWLGRDAVRWIIDTGAHLLVSDIYERSSGLLGIFNDLFTAGVSTICNPVNLHLLTAPHVELTALPLRFETVTQIPCRVIAKVEADCP